MASMYSAKVMEHFANPHNVGELPDANGVGEVGNPKCGDIMRMYLKIENNVIVDVKFLTFGCGAAIATSSMATDLIKGKTVDEALKLTNGAKAVIGYRPFATDVKSTGLTIELTLRVSNPTDSDTAVVDCLDSGKGLYITPSEASFKTGEKVSYTNEDDELVEVTPQSVRLRKRLLSATDRKKAKKN